MSEGDRPVEPGGERPVVELPAPTAWPLVCGFGLALVLGGLVTSIVLTGVGVAIFAVGAAGWWRDVLPRERIEQVTVEPAPPATAAPLPLAAPAPGEARHRMRIPAEFHPYSAGLRGGVVGAVAMAAVAMAYGVVSQGSPWYPVNLLAAVASPTLASADLSVLRAFSATGLVLGFIVHGAISLLVGLLYAVLLPMLPGSPLLWGGVVAPLLWSGGLWACLGLIDPELAARIEWVAFVGSQLAFGLATGWVVARTERVGVLQSLSLGERAGLQTGASPRHGEDGP
jgi:hypothetical protein